MKRKISVLLIIALLATLLSGCRVEGRGTLAVYNAAAEQTYDFELASQKLSAASGKAVTVEMLKNVVSLEKQRGLK